VPSIYRTPSGTAATLRALLDKVSALWGWYQERRHGIQELQSLTDMDAHMLKDIGAAGWLIARAEDRAGAYRRHVDALYPSRASID
jgi:uncharacterized protein YjiS (DUF1127 family)